MDTVLGLELSGSTFMDTVSGFRLFCRSANSLASHIDSFVARQAAMYSASRVDVATHVCFLDLQDITRSAANIMAPLVNLRDILHPP